MPHDCRFCFFSCSEKNRCSYIEQSRILFVHGDPVEGGWEEENKSRLTFSLTWVVVTHNNVSWIDSRFAPFVRRCVDGFGGDTCTPENMLPFSLTTDFTHLPDLERHWLAIHGGQVVAANEGCGLLLSGESLYFSGVRDKSRTVPDFSFLIR